MTTVHSATTTLPSTAGTFDIAFSGGSPFTYTGGALYVAFDWGQYTGTLSTTAVVWCNDTLTSGLLGAQSTTAAPTTLGASNFRPETRLGGPFVSPPMVTTQTSANITSNSAILGGKVTLDWGSPITARGVVYAKTSDNSTPTLGGSGVMVANDPANTLGVFSVSVSSLVAGTSYSFAAYATNIFGTTYTSPVSTFSTSGAPNNPPTITPIAAQTILEDQSTAALAFTIGDDTTPPASLGLTALSSNLGLVPVNNVQFGGSGAARTVIVTPTANRSGSSTITVRVTDANSNATDVTFVVNVTAVNDAPSFAKGANQTVFEDAPAQIVAVWASGLSAGPSDESTQALNFLVSNNNGALFATAPAVAANGTLTFQPAPNASGVATVTVQIHDDGGTANGGQDTSAAQTFTITVNPVNDAPTLAAIADPAAILEDAGLQTVSLASISAGPGETQTLTVTASSNNPGLIPNPTVTYASPNASGSLTYTPLANQSGSAVITVTVQDSGGTANGGVDTVTRTFTVNVTSVNDAPTLDALPPVTLNENAGEQTVNLTGIGTGAPNETDTLVITAQSGDPAVIPTPTITYTSPNAIGTLKFTPAAQVSGNVTITVTVNDGGTENATVSRSFVVTMMSINDAPSFTKGGDQTVDEDSGPQTVGAWATNLSAGPPDEAGQTLNFLVSTDLPALFSTSPAVDANGVLTFTPAPNANGVATVTVRLHDNGGTANGGTDTSAPQTFLITLDAVNDAPSFTKGADQLVQRDSGPQTVIGWGKAISAGPANESAQTVDFLVSADTPSLFATGPAVAPNGTLTFEPAPGATGTTTVTVQLHDSGGTTPGIDTSAPQTFTISVMLFNIAPSFTVGPDQTVTQDAGAQTVSGWAKNISPGPANEAAQVLNFLVAADNPALFTVAPAVAPNGTLTFTPDARASGTTTVTVRLHDNGGTANSGIDTSAPQTFQISVSSYLEELGAYNGLASAAGGAAASHQRSGLIKVTVTKTGVFTGRLTLAGRRYVLSGHVNKSGATTFGRLKTPALDLKRLNATTLSLTLQLDVIGGSGKLTGAITDAGAAFAAIDADRSAYTASRKPVAPLVHVPDTLLGKYTVLFPAKTPAEQGLAASTFPQADGVGTLTISAAGTARVIGTLADGTAISYSNSLSKLNDWPIYIPLARNTGALTGPARFEPGPSPSDLDGFDLHWFKPPTRLAQYSAGWLTGIRVDLLGSKYQPPAAHPAQSAFPNLPPVALSTANILTEFAGGNLASFTKMLHLTPVDRVTALPVGPDRVGLRVNRRTGSITGTFVDTNHKRRVIKAALFQKQSMASGFFLGTTESGSVTLSEIPPAVP